MGPLMIKIKKIYAQSPNSLRFSVVIYLITSIIFAIIWFCNITFTIPQTLAYFFLGFVNAFAIIPGISRMMIHFIIGFLLGIPLLQLILLNYLMASITSLGQWLLHGEKENKKRSGKIEEIITRKSWKGLSLPLIRQEIFHQFSLKINNLFLFFPSIKTCFNLISLIFLIGMSFLFLFGSYKLLYFNFFWSFLIICRIILALYYISKKIDKHFS